MSAKAFEKCKKEILEIKNREEEFSIDVALDLVDNYNLSTEELDAVFELIRNDDTDVDDVVPVKSDIQELYEKYNVTLYRRKRIYKEDLATRDYMLSNTTPYFFVYKDFICKSHAWGELLVNLANYLDYSISKSLDELTNFHTKWSKQDIYSYSKKTNHKLLSNGLFLNCNHTALHACWLVQDILEFYGIDTSLVDFRIHRSFTNEPKELRERLTQEFIKEFSDFLVNKYDKTEESVKKILSNIQNVMNPKLEEISAAYPDFFMFDDYMILYNYASKFEEKVNADLKMPEKNKAIFRRYLDYLKEYYRTHGY